MSLELPPEKQAVFRSLCAAEGLRATFSHQHDKYQVVRVEGLQEAGVQGPLRRALAEESLKTNAVELGIPAGLEGLMANADYRLVP